MLPVLSGWIAGETVPEMYKTVSLAAVVVGASYYYFFVHSKRARFLDLFSEKHMLPEGFIFSYSEIMKDPKRVGRKLNIGGRELEVLHTGGFLRLYHIRCRVYWLAQNMQEHITPDWKIHFSIDLSDREKAWDILAAIFIESGFETGMKVTYESEERWPEKQRGREFTVYVYKYDDTYGQGPDPSKPEWELGKKHNVASIHWEEFILRAERALRENGIRCRGCADGDLHLGRYASLRNEAYIPRTRKESEKEITLYEMPPNSCGWNAAGHKCPMEFARIQRKLRELHAE